MKIPRLPFLSALSKSRKGSKARAREPFQAVSIRTGLICCDAARELEGERVLADHAPSLPLPGCDESACSCTYKQHADRRQGPRRDEEMGLAGPGFKPRENRRKTPDRRAGKGPRAPVEVTDYFGHAAATCKLQRENQTVKVVK